MRLMKIAKYAPFALLGLALMSCGDDDATTTTEKPEILPTVTFNGAGYATSDNIQMSTSLFDHRKFDDLSIYSITISMTNKNAGDYELVMKNYQCTLDGVSQDLTIYKNYDPAEETHPSVSDVTMNLANNATYTVDFAITVPDGKWTTDYVISFETNNSTKVSIHMANDLDYEN